MTKPTSAALLRADYAKACSDKLVNGTEFGLLGMVLVQGGAVWISHMNVKFVLELETTPVADFRGNYLLPAQSGARFSNILTWKAAA